jgi:hypothetical protein
MGGLLEMTALMELAAIAALVWLMKMYHEKSIGFKPPSK